MPWNVAQPASATLSRRGAATLRMRAGATTTASRKPMPSRARAAISSSVLAAAAPSAEAALSRTSPETRRRRRPATSPPTAVARPPTTLATWMMPSSSPACTSVVPRSAWMPARAAGSFQICMAAAMPAARTASQAPSVVVRLSSSAVVGEGSAKSCPCWSDGGSFGRIPYAGARTGLPMRKRWPLAATSTGPSKVEAARLRHHCGSARPARWESTRRPTPAAAATRPAPSGRGVRDALVVQELRRETLACVEVQIDRLMHQDVRSVGEHHHGLTFRRVAGEHYRAGVGLEAERQAQAARAGAPPGCR